MNITELDIVELTEQEAAELIEAMRTAVETAPSYVKRDKSQEGDEGE